MSTHGACVCVCDCMCGGGKTNAVTNMFVSMRLRDNTFQTPTLGSLQENLSFISQSSPSATLQHSTPCNF